MSAQSGPSGVFFAVTPSDLDANKFATLTRGIYVGGAGDVAVVREDNTVVTFAGVPAGSILPIKAERIAATGTTATNIVALF